MVQVGKAPLWPCCLFPAFDVGHGSAPGWGPWISPESAGRIVIGRSLLILPGWMMSPSVALGSLQVSATGLEGVDKVLSTLISLIFAFAQTLEADSHQFWGDFLVNKQGVLGLLRADGEKLLG